jgi:hypothetical protein
MVSKAIRFWGVAWGLCLAPMLAHAGAVANLVQIEFEAGQTTYAPGAKGTVRFSASDYAFGGGRFAYLTVAVLPIGAPFHNPRPGDTAAWDVYGLLMPPICPCSATPRSRMK